MYSALISGHDIKTRHLYMQILRTDVTRPGNIYLRIHRIFTRQELAPGQLLSLSGEPVHYLSRVLRVAPGQRVVLFNGDGSDYAAEVTRVDRKVLDLKVQTRLPARGESHLHITLVQAISRGERMDLTLQKATELGVTAFQPVFSARTEVRLKP